MTTGKTWLHILRERRMILEAAEPHNAATAFTSENQAHLGKNQQLLDRAPPAQCFQPGGAHQHCV